MPRIEAVLQLKPNETIKNLIRKHVVTVIPQLALALVFIVIPFFFLFPLFSLGIFGVVIFFALVLIGIFIALRLLYIWDADSLIITNYRIVDIDQSGILSRRVSEINLSDIKHTSWNKKGILQTLFNMGTVTIRSNNSDVELELNNVSRPQAIHEEINNLKELAIQTIHEEEKDTTEQSRDRRSRVKHIAYLLERVDNNTIINIERELEKKQKEESLGVLFNNNEQDEND